MDDPIRLLLILVPGLPLLAAIVTAALGGVFLVLQAVNWLQLSAAGATADGSGAGEEGTIKFWEKNKIYDKAKKKGEGNRKNGNKYLGWAYVEAVNHMVRFSNDGNRFF